MSQASREQRIKYNAHVKRAKFFERVCEPEMALQQYKLAAQTTSDPTPKLTKKIAKLSVQIESAVREQHFYSQTNTDFVLDARNGRYCLGSTKAFQLAPEIYEKLYSHQCEGVSWLYKVFLSGAGGCILGDDMGLGKTLQIIAFLQGAWLAGMIDRAIVIVPTSLLENWKREFKKWCGATGLGKRVRIYHGSNKRARLANLERVRERGGVLLTTYGLVTNDADVLSPPGDEPWCVSVADEAHIIKNPARKVSKAIRCIDADLRIALSATPIMNNLAELWSLYDYTHRGALLGENYSVFKAEYEEPINAGLVQSASDGDKALGARLSATLRDLIAPYFLRREKPSGGGSDAALLSRSGRAPLAAPAAAGKTGELAAATAATATTSSPDKENAAANITHHDAAASKAAAGDATAAAAPHAAPAADMRMTARKNDLVVWLPLTPQQAAVYERFLSSEALQATLNTKRSPLAALSVLKKICDHLLLLQADMQYCGDIGLPSDARAWTLAEVVRSSCKLRFVFDLLPCLRREGHRTLIFSRSTKMLDAIERVLRAGGSGSFGDGGGGGVGGGEVPFKYVRVDGSVPASARQRIIDQFTRDESIECFLLTSQVGGVGLNLVAADRVIIVDPSWNAMDNQAVDRVYRIGQRRDVVVYRLITVGTIEEKIYRRQVYKEALMKNTLERENQMRYFNAVELCDLFAIGNDFRDGRSRTQQALAAMHGAQRRGDDALRQHVAWLQQRCAGVSDHDLLFTKQGAVVDAAEHEHVLQEKSQQALLRIQGLLEPRTPSLVTPKRRRRDGGGEEGDGGEGGQGDGEGIGGGGGGGGGGGNGNDKGAAAPGVSTRGKANGGDKEVTVQRHLFEGKDEENDFNSDDVDDVDDDDDNNDDYLNDYGIHFEENDNYHDYKTNEEDDTFELGGENHDFCEFEEQFADLNDVTTYSGNENTHNDNESLVAERTKVDSSVSNSLGGGEGVATDAADAEHSSASPSHATEGGNDKNSMGSGGGSSSSGKVEHVRNVTAHVDSVTLLVEQLRLDFDVGDRPTPATAVNAALPAAATATGETTSTTPSLSLSSPNSGTPSLSYHTPAEQPPQRQQASPAAADDEATPQTYINSATKTLTAAAAPPSPSPPVSASSHRAWLTPTLLRGGSSGAPSPAAAADAAAPSSAASSLDAVLALLSDSEDATPRRSVRGGGGLRSPSHLRACHSAAKSAAASSGAASPVVSVAAPSPPTAAATDNNNECNSNDSGTVAAAATAAAAAAAALPCCDEHRVAALPFAAQRCRCALSDAQRVRYNATLKELSVVGGGVGSGGGGGSGGARRALSLALEALALCSDDVVLHMHAALLADAFMEQEK